MSLFCDLFPAACADPDTITGTHSDNDFIGAEREPGMRADLPKPASRPPARSGGGGVFTSPTTLNTSLTPPGRPPTGALAEVAAKLGMSETQMLIFAGILGVGGYLLLRKKGRR